MWRTAQVAFAFEAKALRTYIILGATSWNAYPAFWGLQCCRRAIQTDWNPLVSNSCGCILRLVPACAKPLALVSILASLPSFFSLLSRALLISNSKPIYSRPNWIYRIILCGEMVRTHYIHVRNGKSKSTRVWCRGFTIGPILQVACWSRLGDRPKTFLKIWVHKRDG